ncbi:hypothetical protein KSP39_PZI008678 [Platanthera zijinensis]|uniref:DUF7895 domain-containing protein n=1 Tax=Platanthera zijinensis TaxID=2320716 RepID=A0AAP0BNC6_9ASPA
MESALLPAPSTSFFRSTSKNHRAEIADSIASCSASSFHSIIRGRKARLVSAAIPENSPSIVLAAMAVGAAATLLARRTSAPSTDNMPSKVCEECGGSGVCSLCNGEGFILKKLSAEGADKARMASKNMATRYTAGLPKKWSYCAKCSSSRSCRTCDGTGSVSC